MTTSDKYVEPALLDLGMEKSKSLQYVPGSKLPVTEDGAYPSPDQRRL